MPSWPELPRLHINRGFLCQILLQSEDVGKFGLKLTSLLVDYTHACIRNVVTAANDTTSYGCVSRSLLAFQASRKGGMNEAHLHGVANPSAMRVRQLSAAQQKWTADSEPKHHGRNVLERHRHCSPGNQPSAGDHRNGTPSTHPMQTSAGPHCSRNTKVEDLLTNDYKQVISRQALRLRYGRLATSAHMQALYRVAHILHMTAETPNIPHVKRMHFTDAAVSRSN
jgi:hypothetical protein